MGDSRKTKPLSIVNPELAKQWHPTKNGDLTPDDVGVNTNIKHWWLCEKGHDWDANISNRHRVGTGCPYCKNKRLWTGFNDLETVNPSLASEWHPTKNGGVKPSEVVFGSTLTAFWLCKNNHEWEQQIRVRHKDNIGCPVCKNLKVLVGYNDLYTLNSKLADE